MHIIYALIDPRDYTVHYVGQTTDMYRRFLQHINCEGSSFMKNVWILELRAQNCMVIMEKLEEVSTYQLAIEREAYWIKHFEALREPLANATHRVALKKVKRDQLRSVHQMADRVQSAVQALTSSDQTPLIHVITERIVSPPESTPHVNSQNASPRMSASETEKFIVAYRITGNKDRSLKEAGVNTRYREHATEIIMSRGLRKAE